MRIRFTANACWIHPSACSFGLAALLACAGANPLLAANGTWLGTQDNVWVNNANWSASPFPGSALNETATFDSAGNGQVSLNLSGLFSVGNIVFTGPAVAAYTIGTGPLDSQILVMGTEGEYRIDASAANSQTFNCSLQLGGGSIGGSYTFRNDTLGQTLTLGSVFVPTNSTSGTKTVRLRGAGAITILGDMLRGPSKLHLSIDCTNAVTLSGNNTLNAAYLDGTNGVLKLASGSTTYF